MTRFTHFLARWTTVALTASALVALLPVRTHARTEVRPVSSSSVLALDVWTSRGDGAIYNAGDDITVFFRTSTDCFVTIYDITTDGRTIVLFPQYPDDGFVRGGFTYRLPGYYDGPAFRVTGPRGIEYIHAVATLEPDAFRFRRDGARYHLRAEPISGDPYDAINDINGSLIDTRYVRATATTSFFIGSRVWYPRYYCNSCHAGNVIRDPYAVECSRYIMRAHTPHDYWWMHDYHPGFRAGVYVGPFWFVEVRTMPVHRHRKIRYIDCAWGFANWHPVHMPRRPFVHVEHNTPRTVKYREYERDSRPITYREERERRSGPTRTGTETRTRDADVRTRDADVRTRDAESPTRGTDTRSRDVDVRTREKDVRTRNNTGSSADVTTRARESAPSGGSTPNARSTQTTTGRAREAAPQVTGRAREAAPQVNGRGQTARTPEAGGRTRGAESDASPGSARSRTR